MRPRRAIPVTATAGFPRAQTRQHRPLAGLSRSIGWTPIVITIVLSCMAAAGAVLIDTAGSGAPAAVRSARAVADARAWLRAYVAPSGQVVRRDQGNTTVSEGQAYALLLAEATDQPRIFARVWTWTQQHLQTPGGELAYLAAANGTVTDATPASDADVLAAWALSRYRGPDARTYHADARRLSSAILRNETVSRTGLLLLAAGPWATGEPASLDPSYWSPTAFVQLARFTGDRRWLALATSARAVLWRLTDRGRRLPPDWARLDGGIASPTPAPNHSAAQVRYGLDAQRLVVWLASSCTPRDRQLAAGWWPILSQPGRARALALRPGGAILAGQTNALPPVAAAAAANAAGDTAAARRLLAGARHIQTTYPTYYGGAWLALGEMLLGTGRLGGCGNPGGSQ